MHALARYASTAQIKISSVLSDIHGVSGRAMMEALIASAPGSTGSETPLPGWSKKISRPSDVIASTHP